jgi:exopolysaccharide production protein ExoQ
VDLASDRHPEPVRAAPIPTRTDRWWSILACVTLGFALLDGLGAFDSIYVLKPTLYSAAMSALLGLTLLLTPRGLIRTVEFAKPLLLFVMWMVASYAWTSYHGGFIKDTWRDLITLLVVVVIGQLLGRDRFLQVILRTGYVAIGLIVFALATKPSSAYTAEGLRGGFIHKSEMGSALILMVAAALCLDCSPKLRRALVAVVVVLLLLGRTTTGIASIVLVLGLYVPLVHYRELRSFLGRSFGFLMTGAVVCFGAIYYLASNALVALSGKDLTFSNRTVIWKGVTNAVGQRPLTGYGWSVWAALWREPAAGILRTAGFPVAESHNAALELLLRLGVVGLALYLWLLIKAVRNSLRLTAEGDRAGIFGVLLAAIILIWGFSEALPMTGVWVGLLGVVAVQKATPVPRRAAPVVRRRFLAPRTVHVR